MIESYLPRLEDSIDVTQRQIGAITQQIDGTPAYEQLKRAQSEMTMHESKRKAKVTEARPIHQAFIDLREAISSTAFPRDDFPELIGFVRFSAPTSSNPTPSGRQSLAMSQSCYRMRLRYLCYWTYSADLRRSDGETRAAVEEAADLDRNQVTSGPVAADV